MTRKRPDWTRPEGNIELPCKRHGTTHSSAQFGGRAVIQKHASVWIWDTSCRQGLQELSIERKHADLALHIVTSRAKKIVKDANQGADEHERITLEWVMSPRGLAYNTKVWEVQAYLDNWEQAMCGNCGDPYATENDGVTPRLDHKHFTFDHIAPPRHSRDWERLHARNLIPRDPECNSRKNDMPYDEHLRIEWERTCTRAIAERVVVVDFTQMSLFAS